MYSVVVTLVEAVGTYESCLLLYDLLSHDPPGTDCGCSWSIPLLSLRRFLSKNQDLAWMYQRTPDFPLIIFSVARFGRLLYQPFGNCCPQSLLDYSAIMRVNNVNNLTNWIKKVDWPTVTACRWALLLCCKKRSIGLSAQHNVKTWFWFFFGWHSKASQIHPSLQRPYIERKKRSENRF